MHALRLRTRFPLSALAAVGVAVPVLLGLTGTAADAANPPADTRPATAAPGDIAAACLMAPAAAALAAFAPRRKRAAR